MQYSFVKKSHVKVCLFLLIALTAFTSSVKAGLDYYSIYLGKKLIYERYLNKPLSLENLPINSANSNEMLTVYYSQCNAPNKTGSNRSIVLKDDSGNIIKQWSFSDAQGKDKGMSIRVKELLQLQKSHNNHTLALYYTAEGRTGGEKLASIQPASKDITYMQQKEKSATQIAWQVINMIFKNIEVGLIG